MYAIDRVNGKIYVITTKGQIDITKGASPTTFPLDTTLPGCNRNKTLLCYYTIGSFIPYLESIPYDMTSTAVPNAHDIIQMDVRIQVKYLNLYTQYHAESSAQTALIEIEQDHEE